MDMQYLPWLKRNKFTHICSHPTGKGDYDETWRREWPVEGITYMLNLTIEASGSTSAFLSAYDPRDSAPLNVGERIYTECIEFHGADPKCVYSKAKKIVNKLRKRL